MIGLAEYVMRGRTQALFVVIAGAISSLFCWISAAVIALVALRKGVGHGAWLYFWALLPAGTLAYLYGDTGPVLLITGAFAMALLLRSTVSLPLALLASVLVGLVAGAVALVVNQEQLQELANVFAEWSRNMASSVPEGAQQPVFATPDVMQMAGMLGTGTAVMAVVSLLLARYWQAALYNPGGFGLEFKALRYPMGVALGLVVAGLAVSSMGNTSRTWAMLFFVPLMFAGLALVHSWAGRRGKGSGWFTGFYIAWVLLEPVKLFIAFLAIADSWLDFRERWAADDSGPGNGFGGDSESRALPEDEQTDSAPKSEGVDNDVDEKHDKD